MKKVAAVISLLIALFLFGSIVISVREEATAAPDNINSDFRALQDESSPEFDARMAEERRESEHAQDMRIAEGIAGAVFLVASIALFAWSRDDRPDDDGGDGSLSLLQ
jgi:hypothetical protein